MIRELVIPLGTGLAVFLFGMKVMELALHFWAGSHLKSWMEKFTKTPFRGMMAGSVSTAMLQSSSALTVVVIGLVNAGILTFPRTLGIILGTNIGSTLTTELISLNITKWSVPLLLVSAPVWLIGLALTKVESKIRSNSSTWLKVIRYSSLAVAGFACLLVGLEIMQSIVPALQSRGLFTWFLEQSKKSLLWGILAGAILTAIIQSSAATIAIAMSLAAVQAISLDLGIAIVLGANIGTCGTSLIASIGATRSGQFVAWAHIALNVAGVMLFYPLLPLLREASIFFGTTPSTQIAHAQTIFNIVCSVLALPVCYLAFWERSRLFKV